MLASLEKIKNRFKVPYKAALRLADADEYIKTEYPKFCVTDCREVILGNFKPLLQRDYDGKLNCSLTSMSACINYLTKEKYEVDSIYAFVSKVARFFLYTPRLWGTFSFTIKPIYAIALRRFGIKRRTGWGLIKNVGYNTGRIVSRINSGIPVMLNMFDDGRHCYHNHTVTVIGYRIYYSDNSQKVLLILNDNWSKEAKILDYGKLWFISSINY